jgi:hypothetical protein
MISKMTLVICGNLMKAVQEHSAPQKKPRRMVKMEEDEPIKKPRRIVKIEEDDLIEEKTSYSSQEVAEMDPLDVLEKFILMTGVTSLGCKHCGSTYRKETPVWDNWINSIYTRALKYGLSADMKLPQSCDKQLASNTKSNGVNNTAYRIIRSSKYDNDTKKKAIELRQELLQEMGVSTRPRYYKV